MLIPFLISKIHKARVTGANPEYSGSIAIDQDIIKKAGLREYQKVEVYNITNGNRFSTYVITAASGCGDIVLNGAAARKVCPGDQIIIAAYALLDERELNTLNATILLMDENNGVERVISGKL
ncbi:MAG: aspartate 1-decarboxylase [Candidatus Aminicenantes bacterium]|nr:MAG: aspartate 1-decarboxylase [Candidatus Aminicenantes bacterium]